MREVVSLAAALVLKSKIAGAFLFFQDVDRIVYTILRCRRNDIFDSFDLLFGHNFIELFGQLYFALSIGLFVNKERNDPIFLFHIGKMRISHQSDKQKLWQNMRFSSI